MGRLFAILLMIAGLTALFLVLLKATNVHAQEPKGKTVFIDFGASWCGPCQNMKGTINQLEASGVPVARVDVDAKPQLAAQYHVGPIPCFVAVVDGKEVSRLVGSQTLGRLKRFWQEAKR